MNTTQVLSAIAALLSLAVLVSAFLPTPVADVLYRSAYDRLGRPKLLGVATVPLFISATVGGVVFGVIGAVGAF